MSRQADTTIGVRKETKRRLFAIKDCESETFDDALNKALDAYEDQQRQPDGAGEVVEIDA